MFLSLDILCDKILYTSAEMFVTFKRANNIYTIWKIIKSL